MKNRAFRGVSARAALILVTVAALLFTSCADELAKTLEELYIVDDPVFDPPPGNYGTDVDVVLSSSTPGARLWYTTDGSEPGPGKAGSTLYSTPLPVNPGNSPFRLFVKAYKDGMTPSSEMIGPFNVSYSGPSAPSLRVVPSSGSSAVYDAVSGTWSGPVDVLSDGDATNADPGNQWIIDGLTPRVHYTLDGTIPDSGSPSVNNGTGNLIVTVSSDGDDIPVNALTVVGGSYPDSLSDNVRVKIFFTERVANPVFTTVAGDPVDEVCYGETTVRVTSSTSGSDLVVEYEINGDGNWVLLASGGNQQDVAIFPDAWGPVNGDVVTLRARASGSATQGDSETTTAAFVFLEGSIEKPVISPASGTYSGSVSLSVASGFSGANIYFTLDGSYPSVSAGNLYSSPVTLSTPGIYLINTLAEYAGVESAVSSAVIEVTP